MLVEQHPDGYSAHVEPIQEILNVLADDWVCAISLFVLHHSLSHGGNDIIVSISDIYHSICETEGKCQSYIKTLGQMCKKHICTASASIYLLICDFFIICVFVLKLKNLLQTLHVPV